MNGLSHWTGAIFVAVASVAWIPSFAQTQNQVAELTVSTTVHGEEVIPAVPALHSEQQAPETEPASLGSAIYSPFSSGAIAKQERPPTASNAPSERDPSLTMTLAGSMASGIALVWLLRRI